MDWIYEKRVCTWLEKGSEESLGGLISADVKPKRKKSSFEMDRSNQLCYSECSVVRTIKIINFSEITLITYPKRVTESLENKT